MKIIKAFPPNYEEICKHFDIRGRNTIVFAYGDTLYNPGGGNIDECLMKHEETHERQQHMMGVEPWWQRYLIDPKFRLFQEVEAYQIQYAHAKQILARPGRRALLKHITKDLSGPMYGNIISAEEAERLVRNEE